MQGKFTYGIPIFAAEVTVLTWSSLNSESSANCFDNIIVQPNEDPGLEVIFLLRQFVKISPNFKILFITKVCHTSNLDINIY